MCCSSNRKGENVMVAKKGSTKKIVDYMKRHAYITSNDAWEMFGVTRLAAIIHHLRKNGGYDIETVIVPSTNRFGETANYARYYLRKTP